MNLDAGATEPDSPLARERARRLLAERRADRAERREASLRATCVVVSSVADVSIEAAAQLVDEARRYAQVLAEAVYQERGASMEAASAAAFEVIAEARAAVADLRADLLENGPETWPIDDDEPIVDVGVPGGSPPRSPWKRRGRTEQGPSEAPGGAVDEPGQSDRQQAPPSAWAAPPAEGAG